MMGAHLEAMTGLAASSPTAFEQNFEYVVLRTDIPPAWEGKMRGHETAPVPNPLKETSQDTASLFWINAYAGDHRNTCRDRAWLARACCARRRPQQRNFDCLEESLPNCITPCASARLCSHYARDSDDENFGPVDATPQILTWRFSRDAGAFPDQSPALRSAMPLSFGANCNISRQTTAHKRDK
jgi:hypothetical protein